MAMYDNEYSRGIRSKLSQLNRKVIDHENHISNSNEGEHKITTRLEGMCIRKKNVHGGSGYVAATLDDRGYKDHSTHGAGISAAGVSAAGVSGAGVPIGSGRRKKKTGPAGSGIMDTIGDVIHTVAPLAPLLLAAGKKPRAKKTAAGITGGDLSMLRYNELKGQPPLTAPAQKKETIPHNAVSRQRRMTTKADMPASYIAGAAPKKANPRNEIVKKIMREQSLSLPMASKYVKDHGLYKK